MGYFGLLIIRDRQFDGMIHITVKSTHSILCACGDIHGGSVYSTHGHLGGGGGEKRKRRIGQVNISYLM